MTTAVQQTQTVQVQTNARIERDQDTAAPSADVEFFFFPGAVSPSFSAQRATAQRALNRLLRDTAVAEKTMAPVENEPRCARRLDIFSADVDASTRLCAVAMPFVLASMAPVDPANWRRCAVPWAAEEARDRQWRTLRAVCRAFNETILAAEGLLWSAWFDSLPRTVREKPRVVFCGAGRRAWFVAVAMLQKSWNGRPQEWQREVQNTYQTYDQAVARLRSRSERDRAGVEFLFVTIVAQLKSRGLYVKTTDYRRAWDELPD
jgi:hypothetical protein